MTTNNNKKTVLLIGAWGYIGSKVLNALVEEKIYNVKVLIRPNSKFEVSDDEKNIVEVVRGNMMDKQ